MKTLFSTLALSLALVLPAHAVDEHHPDRAPGAAAAPPMPEATVKAMQDNAARMQKQLEAIAATKEPGQQQKLLMEHMQTMRDSMMLGQQMAAQSMGCPMMGGAGMMQGMGPGMMGMGGMGMMMGQGAVTPDAMANRLQQMERRMDMMQMMMERMSGGMPMTAPK